MVEGDGFEPSKAQLTDLQSAPFGHSGIPRNLLYSFIISNIIYICNAILIFGAGGGNRTPNLLITNQLLYRWATPAHYYVKKLATWNGLEPSTSSVTGWHSNQLNYRTASLITRPLFQPNVKPFYGGRYRARTYDPLLVRQVLSQLS